VVEDAVRAWHNGQKLLTRTLSAEDCRDVGELVRRMGDEALAMRRGADNAPS
jgi:hypothetical protein